MNKQQWHLVYVAAINFYNWKVSSWNQIAKGKIVLHKKIKGKIGRKKLIYNCRGGKKIFSHHLNNPTWPILSAKKKCDSTIR
jgi:hypothetical protein